MGNGSSYWRWISYPSTSWKWAIHPCRHKSFQEIIPCWPRQFRKNSRQTFFEIRHTWGYVYILISMHMGLLRMPTGVYIHPGEKTPDWIEGDWWLWSWSGVCPFFTVSLQGWICSWTEQHTPWLGFHVLLTIHQGDYKHMHTCVIFIYWFFTSLLLLLPINDILLLCCCCENSVPLFQLSSSDCIKSIIDITSIHPSIYP